MAYLLNILYLLLLVVASPWFVYQAARKGKYREGFAAKFVGRVPPRTGDGPCVWLHAVSVGEINLLATLLDELARRRRDVECVISTTTMTGFALAKKKYPGRTVFYCPLDFSWATRAAMRRIRPSVLLLAELELWPNLIRAAREQGARVAVINGRLSERSFRGYGRVRWLVARLLAKIDLIAAQNEEYAARFVALGAPREQVHVTGSLKYDGARTDRGNAATERLKQLAGLAADDVVFLAGSTQEGEEEAALAVYRKLSPQYSRLRLILVPRHPDRFVAVARLLDESGVHWQRRSELDSKATESQAAGGGARVLLVDAVGELGAWWGAATIGFVGGSFGNRGGQNMIEPAAYGVATCFGPNTWNFRDIVAALLTHDAAVVVRDGHELTEFVRRCLAEPDYAAALGQQAAALVAANLGATARTVDLLESLAPAAAANPRAAA